jgi:hypothetical protein
VTDLLSLVLQYAFRGNLIEESVWFGDTSVAILRPNGASQ